MGSTDESLAHNADADKESRGKYVPPPGPVDPIEYLLRSAEQDGIPIADALQYLLQRQIDAITLATANGDVEEVHMAAEGFADIARFFRRTVDEQELSAREPEEAARRQMLSLLNVRKRSLEAWASRASRLFNLATKLHNDRAFWPGRGATRGAETWTVVDDCMTVIWTLAMNLSWLATGDEPPEHPFGNGVGIDIRKPREKLGRLVRDLRNIIDGGRRDTARGRALVNVRSTVATTLSYPWGPETEEMRALSDDVAATKIASDLATAYGDAFGSPPVRTITLASVQKNRAKGRIPAIAADIVWAAYGEAGRDGGAIRPEEFRFPIGDDAKRRGRSMLLKDFSKARKT